MLIAAIAVVAVLLTAQALFSLWLNLYAWDHPERVARTSGPRTLQPPRLSFSVLLPARHEQAVIGETLRKLGATNYPEHLVEVIVICHESDVETVQAAEFAIARHRLQNVFIETFSGEPGKPRGLNIGLGVSENDVICVFDAEDDVHPDIFDVANSAMLQEGVNVLQAGVQLVSPADRWFSVHNCLEYFFWFKSRLHFHARQGMVPLGGNTVFFRWEVLESVGGWDEACLTEDADIGLRLSAAGERIAVVYHHEWVTREETPGTVKALVKQRTRWHQGFLQVLMKGDWRRLPLLRQRALALLTLSAPLLDATLFVMLPVFVLFAVLVRLPVPVAIITWVPLYAVALQALTSGVAARMFAAEFGLRVPLLTLVRVPLTYIPYQLLLGASAMRAVSRQLRNQVNWEKTEHVGAHRVARPVALPGLQDAA